MKNEKEKDVHSLSGCGFKLQKKKGKKRQFSKTLESVCVSVILFHWL